MMKRGLARAPAAALAVVVVAGLVALLSWLAAELGQVEHEAEQLRLQQLVDYMEADLVGDIQKKIRDRQRAAVSLSRNGLEPGAADQRMIAMTLQQTPFYRAVLGLDSDLRIHWLSSTDELGLAVDQPFPVGAGLREQMDAVIERAGLAIDRPLPLPDGDHAVSWFMPLSSNGEHFGYMVTLFAVAEALQSFLPEQFQRELDIVVRSGDLVLKPIGAALPPDLDRWPAHFVLDIDGDGSGFDVHARFSDQATVVGTPALPAYVLFGGSVSSAVLGLALFLVLRNADYTCRLEQVNQRLSQEAESRRQAESELAYLLDHDRLTGLPNRSGSIAHLTGLIGSGQDGAGELAVLLIDLDRFQDINDSLGHELGDELLRLLPERIGAVLTEGDFVGRQGGDEFIVICRRRDRAGVEQLGNAIIHALDRGFVVDGNQIFVSASIGIAFFHVQTPSPEALIQNADTALFKAKTAGRGRCAVFACDMLQRVQHRLNMSRDIRRALQRGDFRVVYQPIVDAATLELRGFEALLRWDHEDGHSVSPVEFIAVAEETGSIGLLGEFVLRRGMADLARWQADVEQPPWLAINVSAVQLQQPDFPAMVKHLLDQHALKPDQVHLEITEEILIRHERGQRGSLNELKALGVQVVVDDFGVGYSALSYLKDFPVSVVKIDRSFVSDIVDSPEDCAITRTICNLARDLGMTTVAEGVETPDQMRLLQTFGCTYAQGYLMARPMERDDIQPLLDGVVPWADVLG